MSSLHPTLPPTHHAALEELLSTYHELNSSFVPRRQGAPTALEFLQHVRRNQPVVFSGAIDHWPAVQKWDAAYLRSKMGDRPIVIAQTPLGNADSVVEYEGRGYFVKPQTTSEPFSSFMEYLQSPPLPATASALIIKYAQSRSYPRAKDNNLHKEYAPLIPDLPPSIPFADAAFSAPPDAVNIWIGNGDSTTALHKDNYENLYCQILGRKKFVLISPLESVCVRERTLPVATYRQGVGGELEIVREEEEEEVHCWPTVDPDVESGREAWWNRCRPLRVELDRGDVLFLPALWYHKVSQEVDEEGVCCAVNYWYDMEFGGAFYSMANFVKSCALIVEREGQKKDEEGGEEMYHIL